MNAVGAAQARLSVDRRVACWAACHRPDILASGGGTKVAALPRSILIVAQHAPPSPLVGARRPAALAKELGRRGHRVTILTSLASGAGPVRGAATIRSRDLLSTRLNWRRESLQASRALAPGRYREASPLQSLVVPDLSLVTWLPFLLPRALRAAGALRPDCVITTGPPQSAHLVGLRPARARCAPGSPTCATAGPSTRRIRPGPSPALERPRRLARAQRCCRPGGPGGGGHRADRRAICASGSASGSRRSPTASIPTTTPGADGAGLLDPERFSLVHTGRLMRLGRRARTLLEGARRRGAGGPRAARPLEVVFAGAASERRDRLVADPRYADVARPVGVLDRPRGSRPPARRRRARGHGRRDARPPVDERGHRQAVRVPGRRSARCSCSVSTPRRRASWPALGWAWPPARTIRSPWPRRSSACVDAPPEPNPEAVRAYALAGAGAALRGADRGSGRAPRLRPRS